MTIFEKKRSSAGLQPRLCALAVVLMATAPVAGQSRTPWGDPDLQGVWSIATITPFERPATLADKAQLTEQEELCFRGEGITQGDVVVGEVLRVRIGVAQLVELEPREEEARHEGVSAIVGEHALDLALEGRGVAQTVALGLFA